MRIIAAMINAPSLFCYEPPALGTALYEDGLQSRITRYWHEVRMDGGNWEAGWFTPLNDVNGEGYLRDWFHNRLGCQIVERDGRVTWRGIVWFMALTLGGVTWEIGLENMYNHVRAEYGSTPTMSAAASNAQSISRYGQKEMILELPDAGATEAANARDRYLELNAWPIARPVAFGSSRQPGLEVRCAGDVFTMQYKYLAETASTLAISTYLTNIITNDCAFVDSGNIATNSVTTNTPSTRYRVWEAIQYYLGLGDGSTPYNLQVFSNSNTGNAQTRYFATDSTPIYEWQNGLYGRNGGKPSAWTVRPGVVRDKTQWRAIPPSGAFLTDGRDALVTAVRVSAGAREPQLKTGINNPEDVVEAMARHQQWLEQELQV